MGAIDEFLRGIVQPQLFPGEAIQICAHAREPHNFNMLMVPQRNDHWLLVATNLRLFLFRTRTSGMWENAPKHEATHPQIFPFDELAAVESKVMHYGQIVPGGPPKMFVLAPHPMCGPQKGARIRFDLYAKAEGLDDQARFVAQFPEWLAGQVQAGAYPMSEEKRAWFAAEGARQAEQARLQRIEADRRAKEFNAKLLPRALAVVWLGVLGALGLSTFVGWHDWSRFSRNRDQYLEMITKDHEQQAKTKKEYQKLEDGEMPWECAKGAKECGPCDHGEIWEKSWKKAGHTPKSDGWTVAKVDGAKWFCPPISDSMTKFNQEQADKYGDQVLVGLLQMLGSFVVFCAWIGLAVLLRKRSQKKSAEAVPLTVAPTAT